LDYSEEQSSLVITAYNLGLIVYGMHSCHIKGKQHFQSGAGGGKITNGLGISKRKL